MSRFVMMRKNSSGVYIWDKSEESAERKNKSEKNAGDEEQSDNGGGANNDGGAEDEFEHDPPLPESMKVYINIPRTATPEFDVVVHRRFLEGDLRPKYRIKFEYRRFFKAVCVMDVETFGNMMSHTALFYKFYNFGMTSPQSVRNLFRGRSISSSPDGMCESTIPIGSSLALLFRWDPRTEDDGMIYFLDDDEKKDCLFGVNASAFCYFLRYWANDVERGITRDMIERRGELSVGGDFEEIGRTIELKN